MVVYDYFLILFTVSFNFYFSHTLKLHFASKISDYSYEFFNCHFSKIIENSYKEKIIKISENLTVNFFSGAMWSSCHISTRVQTLTENFCVICLTGSPLFNFLNFTRNWLSRPAITKLYNGCLQRFHEAWCWRRPKLVESPHKNYINKLKCAEFGER